MREDGLLSPFSSFGLKLEENDRHFKQQETAVFSLVFNHITVL